MSQKTPPMTRRVRLTPGPVRVTHAPQLGPSVKVERHSRLTLMLSVLDGSGVGVRIETLPGESAHDSEPTNWLDLGAFGPVGRSATEPRFFHLATVFGFIP